MNFILRIYVTAQHTEILIVTLDLTLDISKQLTLHDHVHYSLRIILSGLRVDVNRSREIYYSFNSH